MTEKDRLLNVPCMGVDGDSNLLGEGLATGGAKAAENVGLGLTGDAGFVGVLEMVGAVMGGPNVKAGVIWVCSCTAVDMKGVVVSSGSGLSTACPDIVSASSNAWVSSVDSWDNVARDC